jgi:hypothetical protein
MARVTTTTWQGTWRYDFASEGGTAGAKTLRGPRLPNGAVVTDALLLVDVALAGGTATDTVSVGSGESATDVQAALARNNALWTGTGAKRVTLTATSAPLRMTADRAPTFTINATALTAGVLRVLLWVVEAV